MVQCMHSCSSINDNVSDSQRLMLRALSVRRPVLQEQLYLCLAL